MSPTHLPARSKSRKEPRTTLVLDLDETLVHCSVEAGGDADLVFPVDFNGTIYQVSVKKRPHMARFLEMVADKFEVVVFTGKVLINKYITSYSSYFRVNIHIFVCEVLVHMQSQTLLSPLINFFFFLKSPFPIYHIASQQVYADTLLDILDPTRTLIKHRLFRDSCLLVDGNYLKDLNVLGRDLSKTVLVDNSPHAFGYQIDNGIPIESWYDDPNDTELLKLAQFLTRIEDVDDVRPIVRNHFKTFELIRDAR